MADKRQKFPLARSAKSMQENVTRAGPAIAASYTLVGGIIGLGGLGYVIDRWRGTSPWFVLAGLILGIVIGVGAVIVMRHRAPGVERPYRTLGYPLVPGIYMTLAMLLIVDLAYLAPSTSGVGYLLVLTGVPFYLAWRRAVGLRSAPVAVSSADTGPQQRL